METEAEQPSYTVGELAELAGVTVRTLHHYDEIDVVRPSERSAAGYRRYDGADLDRLRNALAYRELGFPLDRIKEILDEPEADPTEHLRRQRELLAERITRLEGIAAAIDKELEARQMGINLTAEDRFEVFGDFDPTVHDAEARERWGETDAWNQSRRRTAGYDKARWLEIRAEAEEIERGFAEMMAAGGPADGEPARGLAEQHRLHIGRHFYDCSPEMHASLGRMYASDERFSAHYEAIAPGLAADVSEAVQANAERR